MPLLVFIDTNILKFAAIALTRLAPRRETLKWRPKTIDVIVHDEVFLNPNDNISNPELKVEAELLSEVANYAKAGVIEFVQSVEARYEEWGLPNMDSQTGFYAQTGGNFRQLINRQFQPKQPPNQSDCACL